MNNVGRRKRLGIKNGDLVMDDYFADYDAYSSEDIVRILPEGIELSGGRKILFDECAENFIRYSENVPEAKYIGEKDADDGSFMLFCSERPVMIKFLHRALSKSVRQRMNDFENQINDSGYSFADMK